MEKAEPWMKEVAVGLMQLEAEVGRLDKHEMCWSCVVSLKM